MPSDIVWSINIMVGLLLVLVSVSIYWIFKYDDWYPNPIIHSHISPECESDDSASKELSE